MIHPQVHMYLCGPTVYDVAHLGHARSAISFDVIRRYLLYKGFQVTFVSNYTDIDDKMINRALEEKISVKELAEKIILEYKKDYADLDIMDANIKPKATEFIPEMIDIIKSLEEKGYTYELEDGIYFDIEKFSGYGKLSHQKIDELRSGLRKEEDKNKQHPQDFVLWKRMKKGEPFWESPWGKGRPGWHIECSAMSMKLLGETLDIHAGGADLIFPHHEDEIAQSECANGKKFSNYWLHNGFVQVDNEKMSKSLGNFFTIKSILEKYSPKAVRLFLISTHYRAPINFTHAQLDQAENTLRGILEFKRRVQNYAGHNQEPVDRRVEELILKTKQGFETAMDDDFETPKALSHFFELIKETNQMIDHKSISMKDLYSLNRLIEELDTVFGIVPSLPEESVTNKEKKWIEKKIKQREQARKIKAWEKADAIRTELAEKGFELEDLGGKTVWKKITPLHEGSKLGERDNL